MSTSEPDEVNCEGCGSVHSVPSSAPAGERGRRMVEDPQAYRRAAREAALPVSNLPAEYQSAPRPVGWVDVNAYWRQTMGVDGGPWYRVTWSGRPRTRAERRERRRKLKPARVNP